MLNKECGNYYAGILGLGIFV